MSLNRFGNSRRQLVLSAAAVSVAGLYSAPVLAQQRTKLKMGYVDTLAVTGQLWTGVHQGHWDRVGIEFEAIKFNTGLELFNAMIGGSLDMLSTGAVISNFPARGQGKAFLINNIEFATAQLWVREDMGVKNWADLKGKKLPPPLALQRMYFSMRPCVPMASIPPRTLNWSTKAWPPLSHRLYRARCP